MMMMYSVEVTEKQGIQTEKLEQLEENLYWELTKYFMCVMKFSSC